ncbi:hypothetical protein FE257_006764 [Aspergillus nanangensis]|uniref:Protein kinase domain-containing protein n=1 Tax=Aspergillus nanangensis TaxID=2582783 RepID=A0AAD4CQI1_ASPNN|nr:hypothetical protein FE257_006764 [Aspergillus nanangensis]
MKDSQRSFVMEQIFMAIRRLQGINLLSDEAQQLLRPEGSAIPKNPTIPLGGPSFGFFSDMAGLVRCFLSPTDNSGGQITITDTDDGGLKVESKYDDIPPVTIDRQSLLALQDSVVLCHNNLELKNIMVRGYVRTDDVENGKPGATIDTYHYEVVEILNWQKAGFLPFALESFAKDLALGTGNLDFPWYRQFKDLTACLIPADQVPEAQKLLLGALGVMLKSGQRLRTNTFSE